MKKLTLTALAFALLLPAFPGGAQSASPTPTPTPTTSVTPTASPSASPSTSPSATPTPETATLQQATTAATQIFAGRTATRGVALTIAGQGLRTGITTTSIASDTTADCAGVACATAAGAAEPLGTTVSATSPGEGNPDPVQAGSFSPAEGLFAGQFGAATAMTTAAPSATGSADGLTLDVTLTQTILGQLPPEITGPLNDGLGQLTGALQPIADGDPTGAIQGVFDTLNGLVGNLQNSPIVRLQGGQSDSSSTITNGLLTSTAESQGLIIVLAPTPESTPLLPEGLAIIEIGASSAQATADGTNPATADATGSVARITLLPGILDAIPDIDPSQAEGLPLDELLDLLPPEVVDLLPEQVTGLLGGDPSEQPSPDPSSSEGPTGTPIDDILPGAAFMQADEDSGGFVINLATGSEQTCILEGTPLASCITVGGTSETFSDDGLGVGVLAAGTDVSLLRDDAGNGAIELSVARSEAGAAADFVTPTIPTPTPTPQTGLPSTGGGTGLWVPALMLMAAGGLALFGLRRRT